MAAEGYGRAFSGIIDLPTIGADAALGEARDLMVSARRSAVVVQDGPISYLHTARSVLGLRVVPSRQQLRKVLTLTRAPYLPKAMAGHAVEWVGLRPDPRLLLKRGIIERHTVHTGSRPIGGIITEVGTTFSMVLASTRFPIDVLSAAITKCVCDQNHRHLAEECQNNQCPECFGPVVCGGV